MLPGTNGQRGAGVWGRKSGPSELRCGCPHLLPPSRCHRLHERHASGENLFRPTIIQAPRPPQRPGAGVPRGVAAGRPLRLTRGDGVIKVVQRPGGGCSRLPASGRGAARDCHDAPHRRAAGPSVRRYFGVTRHWACFEERSMQGDQDLTQYTTLDPTSESSAYLAIQQKPPTNPLPHSLSHRTGLERDRLRTGSRQAPTQSKSQVHPGATYGRASSIS